MTKLKRIVIFLIFLLIIPLIHANYAETPSIKITMLSQEPDPVEPSETVELRFKIENYGSSTLENVKCVIQAEYPFLAYGGVEKDIGHLRAYQVGSDAVIIKYKLKVDEKATQGRERINLVCYTGNAGYKSEDFYVTIKTRDLFLAIENIYTEPKQAEPGKEVIAYVTLHNLADNAIKDIKLSLDLNNFPLAPLTGSQKNLYLLNKNESYTIPFILLVDPKAESGLYKIPLTIKYTDNGTEYMQQDFLTLQINAKPEIIAYIKTTDIYKEKTHGKVIIEIANSGLNNIKLLTAKLIETENFTIISSPINYLGDLDSDDTETVEFNIYVKKIKGKNLILPLRLNYLDSNNNEYEETINLTLRLYSYSERSKYGLRESSKLKWFVIIIVIILIAIYIYKKRKK